MMFANHDASYLRVGDYPWASETPQVRRP